MNNTSQGESKLAQRVGPSASDEARELRRQIDVACDSDIRQVAENARKAAQQFQARCPSTNQK